LLTGKHILQCWAVGIVVNVLLVPLSIIVPSISRLLTLPLWIFGGHGDIFVLMFLGGSLFYGAVCFGVLALIIRRKNLKQVDAAS